MFKVKVEPRSRVCGLLRGGEKLINQIPFFIDSKGEQMVDCDIRL